MDNLALAIVDEVLDEMNEEQQEAEAFVIDDDHKAEWAMKKISEERAEIQRYINICQTGITDYNIKIENAKKKLESKTSFLIGLLSNYFSTVPHRETKTMEVYELPAGKLILKKGGPKFERDDEKLVKWLKDNDLKDYILAKESAKWAELKKICQVHKSKVITASGEPVDGVTVILKPDEFVVEV